MNNIFKGVLAGSFLLLAGSLPIVATAQQVANVSLSGNLNGNAGANNYTGFPITSTYHVVFANQSPITVAQGVVAINLLLPPQLEFLTTYPGIPAGWTYTRTTPQTAVLENTTDALEVLPNAGSYMDFNVPIRTLSATTGTATFGWGVGPTVVGSFANWTVPSNSGNTNSGFTTVLNGQPLNLQITKFEAKADANCSVSLTWTTSADVNTSKFSVERSADGSSFNTIGEVKGAAEVKEYSFVDRAPANQHNLYRIRQIAMDNKSSVSSVEDVKMECSVDAISIYPNPTDGIVYVKGLTDKGTVRVYSAVGQMVLEKQVQNTVEGINMSGLANGLYQIHVMKGDQSVFSTKLIKK